MKMGDRYWYNRREDEIRCTILIENYTTDISLLDDVIYAYSVKNE